MNGNPEARIRSICQAIKSNPARQWDVKDLAKEARLSPWRLIHLFTAQTGTSPYQFVLTSRLDMGADLLASSDKRVKEIAFAVGMTSELFCKRFKRKYGLTPLQWRDLSSGDLKRFDT